jgi:hypothetical protein
MPFLIIIIPLSLSFASFFLKNFQIFFPNLFRSKPLLKNKLSRISPGSILLIRLNSAPQTVFSAASSPT